MTNRKPPVASLACAFVAFIAVLLAGPPSGAFAADQPVIELKLGSRLDPAMWFELLDDFHAKHPNIRVTVVERVDWNSEKVVAAHLAGTPYDVVYTVIEEARALTSRGLLQPLDPFIEKDTSAEWNAYVDDVHPALMEMWRFDGKQYFVPFEWNNMMLFYNTRLYQEAGLSDPDNAWTWSDFLENARRITRDTSGDGVPEVFGYGGFWWNPFGFGPWVFTAGGRMLNDDWTASVLDDPRVVEAVDFIRSLMWEHNVMPRPDVAGQYNPTSETLGMWGAGRWPILGFEMAGFKNYDIRLWPQLRAQSTVLGGGGHGVSSTTQHPEAAWELVKWLNSPYVVDYVTRLGDSVPSLRSIALSDAVTSLPPASSHLYYEALNGIVVVPSPPQFHDVNAVFNEELGKVWNGETSAEQAVAEMHRRINVILGAQ